MKRIRHAVVLLMALVICYLLAGNQIMEKSLVRYSTTFLDIFDTQTEIIGYAKNEDAFVEQVEILQKELLRYHKLYDIYHNYDGINNIKTINDNAGVAPVEVSQEIIDMLKMGKRMYEVTDGQVNIAMGSVLRLWHECRQEGNTDPANAVLPESEELEEARKHTDINNVIIDEEAKTVYLADSEMSLDVGSIGKGYAVQRVAEYARNMGMDCFLLNVGGNICAIGEKADETAWKIGIQNPDVDSDSQYVEKVALAYMCAVTSGNYQRYYTVDGKRYCHIIDPDTLMPGEYYMSVTVIAADSGIADALSTALFNMPYEEGNRLLKSLNRVEAMWILQNGTVMTSEGFHNYVVE